jgi:hypothetical protein
MTNTSVTLLQRLLDHGAAAWTRLTQLYAPLIRAVWGDICRSRPTSMI